MNSSAPHAEPLVIFRSIRSETAPLLLLLVLVVLAIFLTARFEWSVQRVALGTWAGRNMGLPIPLFAILPLGLLANILHSALNYRYILCDTYVLEVSGLLDLRRRSLRLNYIHIRGVEISASVWQQLLGVADLIVIGPIVNHSEHTIQMKGIARAHAIKDFINAHIQDQLKQVGNPVGGVS